MSELTEEWLNGLEKKMRGPDPRLHVQPMDVIALIALCREVNRMVVDTERLQKEVAGASREHHDLTKNLVISHDTLRIKIRTLRRALINHRIDLHNRSNRPCPTCRDSARALGIIVPDMCAHPESDRAALEGKG